MVKAVFFDIDGTLASFQTHRIPQSAFETLQQLHEKGILLFIATGRAKDGLEVLEGFPFDGYITLNGQYCFDAKGNVLYENTIQREDLEILVAETERDPFPAGFVMRDTKVFNFRDERVDEIHAITHNDNHPAGDVSNVLDEKIYQVMCFIDEKKEKELLAKMPHCTSARWHPLFTDISPLGGTKVKGIEVFRKHFGIELEETMSVGDGGNDLEMLTHTGISVAMGNAPEEVKAIADYVTDDVDHEGLIKAFRHFTLIYLRRRPLL